MKNIVEEVKNTIKLKNLTFRNEKTQEWELDLLRKNNQRAHEYHN